MKTRETVTFVTFVIQGRFLLAISAGVIPPHP